MSLWLTAPPSLLSTSPRSKTSQRLDFFMCSCTALTTIDNVLSIGSGFLSYCSALLAIDLCPLHNVPSLESYFMSGCLALTSIDLTPLCSVTTIEGSFMRNCVALTHVSGFQQPLTSVGSVCFGGCFSGCDNVKNFKIATVNTTPPKKRTVPSSSTS